MAIQQHSGDQRGCDSGLGHEEAEGHDSGEEHGGSAGAAGTVAITDMTSADRDSGDASSDAVRALPSWAKPHPTLEPDAVQTAHSVAKEYVAGPTTSPLPASELAPQTQMHNEDPGDESPHRPVSPPTPQKVGYLAAMPEATPTAMPQNKRQLKAVPSPERKRVAATKPLVEVQEEARRTCVEASQPRGAFVVLEGLDRSGKSTQCAKVEEKLRSLGLPVKGLRFPDRSTPIGQEINAYLSNAKEVDHKTIHELFSKNRWEKMREMKELLASGTTLIVDRYAFSGVAFSAAKGLDREWCKEADSGLLRPDLVIFLYIDPQAAAKRGDYGAERYERIDFQKIVAEEYLRLKDASWKVLDASKPLEMVSSEVCDLILSTVKNCSGSNPLPLGCLWDSGEDFTISEA